MERPQGSVRNQVTVVFDGNSAYFGNMTGGDVRVVFSDGQDADQCIKAIVEDSADQKKIVVVSDDKGIILYVRALGAKVLSVREFAGNLFRQTRRASTSKKSLQALPTKNIPLVQMDKINKELEKLWVK